MDDYLDRACEMLQREARTCVICGEGVELASDLRGVSPLTGWIDQGVDVSGCYVADRVVGRAAALLFAYMGIAGVFAHVMSEPALLVLEAQGIPARCDQLVPYIMNRTGDGRCPMEEATDGINDPVGALAAVRARQVELRSASSQGEEEPWRAKGACE